MRAPPNTPFTESRSVWSRRWPAWLALAAGTAVSLLAVFTAYHLGGLAEGSGSDWLGLAFYLCGAVVTVTQGVVLLAAYRRSGKRAPR
jgi:hypothetical protein